MPTTFDNGIMRWTSIEPNYDSLQALCRAYSRHHEAKLALTAAGDEFRAAEEELLTALGLQPGEPALEAIVRLFITVTPRESVLPTAAQQPSRAEAGA